jgi:hypothetical protein
MDSVAIDLTKRIQINPKNIQHFGLALIIACINKMEYVAIEIINKHEPKIVKYRTIDDKSALSIAHENNLIKVIDAFYESGLFTRKQMMTHVRLFPIK